MTVTYAAIDAKVRQDMFAGATAKVSAGRIGEPEDIAEAVIFAVSNPLPD